MTTKFKQPYVDYSKEGSTATAIVVDAITDLQVTDLYNAFAGVTIGGEQQCSLVVETPKDGTNDGPALSPLAQRENKWLVTVIDPINDGKLNKFEIPCVDLTALALNSDLMDLSAGVGLTFKTQVELLVLSPAGNPVTIIDVKFVGRKL